MLRRPRPNFAPLAALHSLLLRAIQSSRKPLMCRSLEPPAVITNSIPAPKVQLLSGGAVAVISIWDESKSGFEGFAFYEIRNWGICVAPMFEAEKFIRSQSVVARVVSGETLIVPIRGKVGDLASIYSFNGAGTLIWKLLDSPKTIAQLAESVAQEYEVDAAQAERDVESFVTEMKAVGLVEVPASVAMAGD